MAKNRVNAVFFEECFCEFWCECTSESVSVQSETLGLISN